MHKKLLDFIHPYEKPIYSVFCVMSKNIRLKNGEEKNPFSCALFWLMNVYTHGYEWEIVYPYDK